MGVYKIFTREGKMEISRATRAPLAITGLLGLTLLAPACDGKGEGKPNVNGTPTRAATAASSAPAVISSCKFDSALNPNGWDGTEEYGAAAQQTADQYHLKPTDARVAVVDCETPVQKTNVIAHREILVEGVSGTCALLGTVSLSDGTPGSGNYAVAMCWGVTPNMS
jgi:hypothetical protein